MTNYKGFVRAAALALLAAVGTVAYADSAAAPEAFTLALPDGYAAFTKQVQAAKSADGGDIETTNWISKAPTGEAVIVTMSRMPAKITDPQKMMTSTRESLLKTLKASVENEEAAADSTRINFRSEAAVFRAQLAVVDNRFYQLLYVGRSDEQRTAPTVSNMFSSFKINEPAVDAATPAAAPAAAATPAPAASAPQS